LNELQKQGVLEKTLVIITSDHGEEFLEHGVMDHGFSLYWPSVHVPLIISFPSRVPANTCITEPVSLRDLAATALDLVGIQAEARFPGSSLARSWEREYAADRSATAMLLSEVEFTPGYPNWYPVTKGGMKSLVADRYHYIKNGDDREELYDFVHDPLEMSDLTQSQEGRQAIEQFRTSLEAILLHG
jgi:arylsulfatase A-like enzyme